MSELSSQCKELLKFYDSNYDIISKYELYSTEKQYIGKYRNEKCRFCGKVAPDTTFRDDAHAIPTYLGNRTLFTNEECDECNQFFGNTIEDQFSKFLGIRRTMSKIRGRKGVPSYRLPGRTIPRVDFDQQENAFNASSDFTEDFLKINLETKNIVMKIYRQPYRRRSAFKCLVRIALGLMPEDELQHFVQTIHWIREVIPEEDCIEGKFFCFYSVSPASLKGIDILLLRRKCGHVDLPYMSFYLAFHNFTFQIFLPFCSMDRHLVGKTIHVPRLPALHERIDSVNYSLEDFSSNELKKDELDILHFKFQGEMKIMESDNLPLELKNKFFFKE